MWRDENMKLKKDVEVAETENRELQEEKFELGYRIGLSEGIAAALEAINDLSDQVMYYCCTGCGEEVEHLEISPEILQKIRKIHQAPRPFPPKTFK